jgi:4-amino-4-deoxy-L-arabinose transferase-like glycosyltransferase
VLVPESARGTAGLSDNPRVRLPVVAALATLLLASVVRLPHLGERGLAWAEQTAFLESQGFSTTAAIPTGRPLTAEALPRRTTPLGPGGAGLAGWTRLAGTSETALRLPSAVAGILTVTVVALVGLRLAGPRAAAWAGALVALSPIHTLASRQAGPEAPLVLALVLALALLARVEESGSRPVAIALGLALALLAASGVAAFAALAVLLLAWLPLRAGRRGVAALSAATALVVASGAALLGLALSPLDFGEIPFWMPDTTASGVARCAGASLTRVAGLEYHLVASQARDVLPLTALFVGLMAVGAARLPRRAQALLVAGAALPFLVGVALALATGRVTPLQAHRLLGALPFAALLAAAGLASLRGFRAWAAGLSVGGTIVTCLALALARPGLDTSPTRATARAVARCRTRLVAQRPLDLLSLAAWGVSGPFVLQTPPLPQGPAIVVGPSSACLSGGARCAAFPACPTD